jgi:hypothetical protein
VGIDIDRYKKTISYSERSGPNTSLEPPTETHPRTHNALINPTLQSKPTNKKAVSFALKVIQLPPFKQFRIVSIAVILAIIFVSSVVLIIVSSNHNTHTEKSSHAAAQAKKPSFSPLVPSGESQLSDLSGGAYDSAHNSYTYDDLYLGVPIRVSEQPIPTDKSNSSSTVARVAASLHATSTINTDSGLAYLTANGTYGKQTIVFSKNNLLIFIQSSDIVEPAAWSTYIDSLQ